MRLLLDDFDTEVVIGVALKTFISISRNLVLPVGLGNWWADIVGVQSAESGGVVQSQNSSVFNKYRAAREVVPDMGAVEGLAINTKGLRLVLKKPDVVFILVRVQGDLLLLATSGIHEWVRVQIAALSVDVTDAHAASKSDISGNIIHSLVVESGLELGAHETVTITGVDQAKEVDGKHGHVEGDGNDDEAESPRHQMLEPKAHGDVLVIAQKNPEL
uniref:Uncharacterized protein n=1 Tax=Photinus pyralis TaxID=7054 RepID=A0A1Y1KHV6_PHOPY